MKRHPILSSLLLLLVLAFTSCTPDDGPAPVKTKAIAGVSLIADVSQADLEARVTPSGMGPLVKTGIRAYRVLYNTQLEDGSSGQATGLLLVPATGVSNLTLVSLQHGTLFNKQDAPSLYNSGGGESYILASAMAAMVKGYIVAMPDYLGYGSTAASSHPYVHRQTLARNTVDMLRAAREFAKDSNIGVNPEIILAGYSEGGYATMAAHKMLEEDFPGEFKVGASYPGAGPYDIMGTAKTVLQTNKTTDPVFVLSYVWVTLTYDRLYGINAPLSDYFTLDNHAAIQAFMSGDMATAVATINPNPSKVFAPAFINKIVNQVNSPMHNAMQDNRIDTWSPTAKVILYHSQDDEWVPVANSESALAGMKARGAADVSLVKLSGNHSNVGALQYFSALFQKLQ